MPHEPTVPDGADRCVGEEEAIGFVGRAAANEANIAGTLAHIEGCARCRRLVGEAARLRHESAPGVRATSVTVGERLGGRYEVLARVTAEGDALLDEVTYDALDHQEEVIVTVRTFGLGLMPGSGPAAGAGGQSNTEAASLAAAAEVLAPALRPLAHPNLRRVLDAGVHQRAAVAPSRSGRAMGIPWVAVELVDGEPLDEWIARNGPLTPDAALPIVTQLVAALSALHGVSVTASYAGFGARNVVLVGDEGSETRRVVLDPLAAERLAGSGASRAPNGDIGSLGAVMFHLLAGRPPFSDDTPAGSNAGAQRAPRLAEVVPGADQTWDEVIGRCLSPRGLRRYRTALDVQRALTGARRGWAPRWLTTGRAR